MSVYKIFIIWVHRWNEDKPQKHSSAPT